MVSIFSLRVALDRGVSPLGSFLMRGCALPHLVSVGTGGSLFGVSGGIVCPGCPSGYNTCLDEAVMSFLFFWPTSMVRRSSGGRGGCRLAFSSRVEMGMWVALVCLVSH